MSVHSLLQRVAATLAMAAFITLTGLAGLSYAHSGDATDEATSDASSDYSSEGSSGSSSYSSSSEGSSDYSSDDTSSDGPTAE